MKRVKLPLDIGVEFDIALKTVERDRGDSADWDWNETFDMVVNDWGPRHIEDEDVLLYTEMANWLLQSAKGWNIIRDGVAFDEVIYVEFERDADAVLFKLTFGGMG